MPLCGTPWLVRMLESDEGLGKYPLHEANAPYDPDPRFAVAGERGTAPAQARRGWGISLTRDKIVALPRGGPA